MRKLFILFFVIGLVACHSSIPPSKPVMDLDTTLTWGIMNRYGHYYTHPSLKDLQVASLDIYSEGLYFDSIGALRGKGTNLYISDLFLEDTVLEEGIYSCDTTPQVRHFLPTIQYGTNYSGTYLLTIDDGTYVVYPVQSGKMEVTYYGDSIFMHFALCTDPKKDKTVQVSLTCSSDDLKIRDSKTKGK